MLGLKEKTIDIKTVVEKENFSEVFDFLDKATFPLRDEVRYGYQPKDILHIYYNPELNKFVLGGDMDSLQYHIEIPITYNNPEYPYKTKSTNAIEVLITSIIEKDTVEKREKLKALVYKSAKTKVNNRFKKEFKFIMQDSPDPQAFWKLFINREVSMASLSVDKTLELVVQRAVKLTVKKVRIEAFKHIKNYLLDYVKPEEFAFFLQNNTRYISVLRVDLFPLLPKSYLSNVFASLIKDNGYTYLINERVLHTVFLSIEKANCLSVLQNLPATDEEKEKILKLIFENQELIQEFSNTAYLQMIYL